MHSKKFDASDPTIIPTVWAKSKVEANSYDALEGHTKFLIQTLLRINALIAFKSAFHVDVVDADSLGIKTLVN